MIKSYQENTIMGRCFLQVNELLFHYFSYMFFAFHFLKLKIYLFFTANECFGELGGSCALVLCGGACRRIDLFYEKHYFMILLRIMKRHRDHNTQERHHQNTKKQCKNSRYVNVQSLCFFLLMLFSLMVYQFLTLGKN